MTCQKCRENYAEQESQPPCDETVGPFVHVGGLNACPWWKYGDSPGVPRDPLAEEVLDLAELVQAIGWEAALGLAPHIQCTDYEADLVRDGVLWVMQQEGLKKRAAQRAAQQG